MVLLILATVTKSQVTLKWVDNLVVNDITGGKSIVHDDKNRIYATSDYNYYAHIIRFNQNTGARKWNDSIPSTESVKLKAVNGFLYFIGNYSNGGSALNTTDFIVAKFDSLGNKLWQSIYNDSLDYGDYAIDMEIDNAGNVYVAGNTLNPTGLSQNNITIVKYDANGSLIWKSEYGGVMSEESVADIAIDNSGNSYVAGTLKLYNGNPDFLLLKFGVGGGAPGWSYIYNNNTGNGPRVDGAHRVIVNSFNEIVAAGLVEGFGGGPYNVYTAKFNSAGTKLWQNLFHEGDCTGVKFLQTDIANNIYIVAGTDTASKDGHVVGKIDNQGVLKGFNDSGNFIGGGTFNDHYTLGAYCDKYSNLYVTGYSGPQVLRDCFVMKYDSLMHRKWSYYYSTQGSFEEEEGHAICVDSLQDIYVTGYNDQSSTSRMLTFKLCQIRDFCDATHTGTLGLGFNEKSVAKLKFNNDTYDDLVVADSTNKSLKIYLGNSSNNYTYATAFSYTWTPNKIINADINNDGVLELLVHNSTNDNIAVIFSNGSSSFSSPVFYNSSSGINLLLVEDFNHDGYVDIFTKSGTQNLFSILLNNGNATFSTPINVTHDLTYDLIVLGDINGDQYPDVMASNSVFSNTVYKYINSGTNSFTTSTFTNSNYMRIKLLVGKFDSDNYVDMVEVASNGAVYLNKGNGLGGFTGSGNIMGSSSSASDAIAYDFNYDGRQDFMLGDKNTNALKIYLSYGCTNGYQLANTYTLGMPSGKLTELVVNGYNTVVNGVSTSTLVSIWGNNCEHVVTSGVVTSLNEEDGEKQAGLNFSVYPNPFSNQITCSFSGKPGDNASIEITDIIGEVILRIPVNQQQSVQVSMVNYVSGIYFFKLCSGSGTETLKVLKIQ
jgi:hypothetical protein